MPTGFRRVIAIDGPAASGKSSVARELARRLGFVYVNSGAIYRAITWYVLQRGISLQDSARIAQTVKSAQISCRLEDDESRVWINDVDPTSHLRDDPINKAVSQVSTVSAVRDIATEKMRNCARSYDVVVEGRDIGSVVFPDATCKFYIDASPEVRFRRRAAEGQQDEIAARDRADSSRHASPLIVSPDAHIIDTSDLTIEEVIDEIVGRLKLMRLNE